MWTLCNNCGKKNWFTWRPMMHAAAKSPQVGHKDLSLHFLEFLLWFSCQAFKIEHSFLMLITPGWLRLLKYIIHTTTKHRKISGTNVCKTMVVSTRQIKENLLFYIATHCIAPTLLHTICTCCVLYNTSKPKNCWMALRRWKLASIKVTPFPKYLGVVLSHARLANLKELSQCNFSVCFSSYGTLKGCRADSTIFAQRFFNVNL